MSKNTTPLIVFLFILKHISLIIKAHDFFWNFFTSTFSLHQTSTYETIIDFGTVSWDSQDYILFSFFLTFVLPVVLVFNVLLRVWLYLSNECYPTSNLEQLPSSNKYLFPTILMNSLQFRLLFITLLYCSYTCYYTWTIIWYIKVLFSPLTW